MVVIIVLTSSICFSCINSFTLILTTTRSVIILILQIYRKLRHSDY